MTDPIYVTQPYLPPLEEVLPALEDIWSRKVLTNVGPYHQKFEVAVAEYLGVEHLSLVTNGTIALSIALEALHVTGEVITTPFSFVATSHALKLRGAKPVFVDVVDDGVNIDPAKVEEAVTNETSAILPVHCYGDICDVEALRHIANENNLSVVYDAAHAFGVNGKQSFWAAGDMSTVSFHATKSFNTFEGGAIITNTAERKLAVDRLRNFGFRDEVTVDALGANGKMNEFCAALGLIQLKHFDHVREQRGLVDKRYREGLSGVTSLRLFDAANVIDPNYSYFPIFVGPDHPRSRDQLYTDLRDAGIFARRYFYPLISQFPMYRNYPSARPKNLPNATRLANEVLCLPIYPGLPADDQDRIIDIVRGR